MDAKLDEIDMPLLLALQALLEQQSVTGAARALGRTQSSVSRTLIRLRDLFGDPLLAPVGRGLQRTARGTELLPRLEQSLKSVRSLLIPPAPFEASRERRTVRIAAADYAQVVLLDAWMHRVRTLAPGLSFEVHPIDANSIEPLARGALDLAIAPRLPTPGMDQFVFRPLIVDRMRCVLRRGHPALAKPLTLARWLALEHVMVGTVLPNVSAVQQALHALGKTRRVAVRVPSMVSALHLVRSSDLTCALPERLLARLDTGVVVKPLPLAVEPLSLDLVWHPRVTTDPFHRWLRESLLGEAKRSRSSR